MECLFAPRRSLDTCSLPTTVHVCAVVIEGTGTDVMRGLESAVNEHALMRARIVGDGRPAEHGPLGAPLAKAGVLKYVLAPFGDDNMRVGVGSKPFRFEEMKESASSILEMAAEPMVSTASEDELDSAWRAGFKAALDARGGDRLFEQSGTRFEFDLSNGPLWRCKIYRSPSRTVVLLGFNHAISDQPSAMAVVNDIVKATDGESSSSFVPPSLESAILECGDVEDGKSRGFGGGLLALDKGSLPYLAAKASESSVSPLVVSTCSSSKAEERSCVLEFKTLEASTLEALRSRARLEKTTVGSAFVAAAALAFDAVSTSADRRKPVKVLQSLDMRRFGDFESRDRLGCHAGSFDVLIEGGEKESFWDSARSATAQLAAFVDADFGKQSVRVFDWAMDSMEMARLVELEADNPLTLGRAYACGVSNAGVFEMDESVQVYYATSNSYSGSALQAYVVTVNGDLRCCFEATQPIVSEATLHKFSEVFLDVLRREAAGSSQERLQPQQNLLLSFATNGVAAGTAGAAAGFAAHLPGWTAFGDAFSRAAAAGGDLVAPFGFWLFFAVMHPLIGGAGVGLGELAWRFPGYSDPLDLDAAGPPILFTLLSLATTQALLATRATRAALAALALFWMVDYVGAGLTGTTPDIASYNLALDDAPFPPRPDAIRGCPTYAQVASPSMRDFDVTKYQGKWYELAYHDWTQFSEVYDTSLDIKLADDGKTWYDAFAVKGPSPIVAPRSWRGSPVANGALYPLYGTLDPAMTPGSLLEKGFGNIFPNYIIDVKKDGDEYTEAIQFQCLEAGGVRVFEGINFLSREPKVSQQRLDDMFERAKAIAPYGATKDQMHIVLHTPDFVPVENWWQDAWKFVGLDKLLELIAADI